MADLIFKHSPEVTLVQHMGDDSMVVAAARVSTNPEIAEMARKAESAEEWTGLIKYLMAHRHGTPFEHNAMTFRVAAPIFVFREWHRHRVWSYNEESGRYKQLAPVFHIPDEHRPLINIGTSARPIMAAASPEVYERQCQRMEKQYGSAYAAYEEALADGVAKEVAREVLPVGIFSTMYASANLRGILHFLSLRTHDDTATFVSYPQYEIEQAAKQVENIVAEHFPISYSAFCVGGRVAP